MDKLVQSVGGVLANVPNIFSAGNGDDFLSSQINTQGAVREFTVLIKSTDIVAPDFVEFINIDTGCILGFEFMGGPIADNHFPTIQIYDNTAVDTFYYLWIINTIEQYNNTGTTVTAISKLNIPFSKFKIRVKWDGVTVNVTESCLYLQY